MRKPLPARAALAIIIVISILLLFLSNRLLPTPVETATADGTEGSAVAGGTLTASEAGFGGDVTVNVTLADDGTIAGVTAEGPGETAGIGSRTWEEPEFLAQFVGKTSGEGVDALSGATITSEAIIKAVDKALASQ